MKFKTLTGLAAAAALMGAVAPMGGALMIMAWLLIALAALRTQSDAA